MLLAKNDSAKLIAILGPTNTGKTYLAFDRMLSFKSGIFGFPLRLLARENYDKALKKLGSSEVALLTGEEKILPEKAKYFFCTVESMPLDKKVEFVAIDEIQLAADFERGHIFTDRILNLRGYYETIFLGSLIIKNLIIKLFPKINIETRDRFSKLSYSSKQNISKLKPRSAIVAFNINKVYEIAETIRQHRGGAAVVLGSLSPRTRNAQVDIYENKKVDFLIATDAIGMGLNLNINHVAFSSIQKFDGKFTRNLYPSELGQIAGRAGRYRNDGTFSFTKDAGNIDPIIIQAIEDHNFNNLVKIYWRNSKIDFSSVLSVLESLKQFPIKNFLVLKKNAQDENNFRYLSNDQEVKNYLKSEYEIKLLWDICRIPDFQKFLNDNYINLLKVIFLILVKNDLIIPENWINEKIKRLDNYDGGIDELTQKISHIRTWTYISNQSNWLQNNEHWKNKTRNIEDNLSDRLHDRLTNRFVDASASHFVYAQNKGEEPEILIHNNKEIKLNGQNYGYISGFDLKLLDISKSSSLFFLNHVKKTIRFMIENKVTDFINAPDESISLSKIENVNLNDDVSLFWGDEPIGILKKGESIFLPKVEVLDSNFLDTEKKILVSSKLQKWIDNKILNLLKPIKNDFNKISSSSVRQIAYNLFNALGTMSNEGYKKEIKNFDETNKSELSKLGIRIGTMYFFVPNYLKKEAMELNALLWSAFNNTSDNRAFPFPKDGRVSFSTDKNMPESYWHAIGHICVNNFLVRVDVFERIFFIARQKVKFGPFLESSDLMNPLGCNSEQLSIILKFCGFDSINLEEEKKIYFINQVVKKKLVKDKKSNKKVIKIKNEILKKKKFKPDPNSPFAVLEKLL
tara:strand:- start:518 stop:3085 length:2568 start_codon:yes stop_codon:yes gene_type:complete